MFSTMRKGVGSLAVAGLLVTGLLGGAAYAHHSSAAMAGVSVIAGEGTFSNPLAPDKNGDFTFTVAPSNFILDAASIGSKVNKPGSGHYHVYLDRMSLVPTQVFNYYITAGASRKITLTSAQLTKAGATMGTHTLYVVLANNDHSLIKPIASTATVIRLGPSLLVQNMAMPSSPTMIPATGDVTFNVSVSGFKFAPNAIGSKVNTPGSGHYHVYVDSVDPVNPFKNYVAASGLNSVVVNASLLAKAGAGPGVHTLYFVLANNDHSLISPLTGDYTTVQIAG